MIQKIGIKMELTRMMFFMLFLFALVSCNDKTTVEPNLYTYQMPEQLDDGWSVSSLQEQGMDTGVIEQVTSKIMSKQFRGIHSLLIVKNGVLVHEAYFEEYQRNSLHTVYSITKSVSSTLIGLAINQGLMQSVDDAVLSFFPQYSIQDSNKQKIKLHHLLTLTSGLLWDEKSYPYSDPRNTETQMVATNDWMKFVLERPTQSDPGAEWVYNTGSVHLLSGIIKHASGMYADEFAEQTLFQPLEIQSYEWNKDPQGHPCTGGTLQGLRLISRDTAKFGYIFLNKGKWKDLQVVPEAWVEESTQKHVDIDEDSGFGYLWRTGSFIVNENRVPHFYAAGYGGQTIHIVPELDLMIVFTCWDNAKDADIFLPMLLIYSAIL
jgi:CubicO group peptidase (beta-lactamase class C family)